MSLPELRITVRGPGDGAADHVLLLRASEVLVGRSRRAGVRLPSPDVSGAHARLTVADGGLLVEDLGGVNGTQVAGRALPSGQPRPLPPGAPITIGDFTLRVELGGASPPDVLRGADGTATLAACLVRDLLGGGGAAASQARLEITAPPSAARVLPLVPGPGIRLGRDPRCEIAHDDPELSREHAELEVAVDRVVLRDLDSKNGVWVGGERIAAPRPLHHGDVVTLGPLRLVFVDPAEELLAELAAADEPDTPEELRDEPSAAPHESEALPSAPPDDSASAEPPATAPPPSRAPTRPAGPGQLARGLVIGLLVLVMIGAAVALWMLFR